MLFHMARLPQSITSIKHADTSAYVEFLRGLDHIEAVSRIRGPGGVEHVITQER
jgi:hypothetical protein